jgi:K+-sensing histidine kinase KdpD
MTDSHIDKKIKHARIAAMVSGTVTLAGSVALIMNQAQGGFSLLNLLSLIDVLFIFSMAYGIYRKSRICAVLMFEYFLLSKIFSISISTHMNSGVLITGLIFLFFLFRGITGTFAYHKIKTRKEGITESKPLAWILAGSGGLIVYVLVLPGLLI